MCGEEDRLAVITQIEKNLQQLLAGDRVEPAGRLIEKEQIGPVGEREGEQVFDLHAVGELFGRLALVEIEEREIALIDGVVPVAVKAAGNGGDCSEFLPVIEVHPRRDKADTLLDRQFMFPDVESPEADLPVVGRQEGEQRVERGRLTGTVAADEAGDFSLFQRETDVVKREARITFQKIFDFQHRVHFPSSCIFRATSRKKLALTNARPCLISPSTSRSSPGSI